MCPPHAAFICALQHWAADSRRVLWAAGNPMRLGDASAPSNGDSASPQNPRRHHRHALPLQDPLASERASLRTLPSPRDGRLSCPAVSSRGAALPPSLLVRFFRERKKWEKKKPRNLPEGQNVTESRAAAHSPPLTRYAKQRSASWEGICHCQAKEKKYVFFSFAGTMDGTGAGSRTS